MLYLNTQNTADELEKRGLKQENISIQYEIAKCANVFFCLCFGILQQLFFKEILSPLVQHNRAFLPPFR